MKNLILTLIITLPLTLWGQGWEQTFGGNEGREVQQTSDGGYIITGHVGNSSNGRYVCLIKTDGNGNELWTKTFGTLDLNYGRSVKQTSDGGYIITGYQGNLLGVNDRDIILIKTDGNGNEQWTKTFGGSYDDNGSSVQQTTDGGYIVTGSSMYTGNGLSDVILIKTDGNGNEVWTKTLGGIYHDSGSSVQQTTDGGYIITGVSGIDISGTVNNQVLLLKTDNNGNEQWTNTFGGLDNDQGRSVQQTSDGGYIITGKTESFGNGNDEIYLIKTDGNGNEQWSQTFGSFSNEWCNSVQQTTDGGYIMTGFISSNYLVLIKTDENGIEQWSQTFVNGYEGYSVQQTTDGGFIITGTSYISNNNIYLIKTNQFGNITSTFEIPLPNPNRKLEKTVNIKGQEIKPQTNTPIIEIFDDGSLEKKIIIEK